MNDQNKGMGHWDPFSKAEFLIRRPEVQRILRSQKKLTVLICLSGGNRTDRLAAAILLKEFGDQLSPGSQQNIEWSEESRVEMAKTPVNNYLRKGIIPLGVHKNGVFGRRSGSDISLTEKVIRLLRNKEDRDVCWPLGILMTNVLLHRPHSKGEPLFWFLADYWDRSNISIEGQIQRMREIINGWLHRQRSFFDVKREIPKFKVETVKVDGKEIKIAHAASQNRRVASRILQGTTKLGPIDIVIVENETRLAVLTKRRVSLTETAKAVRTKVSPKIRLDELKELLNRVGGGPALGVDFEVSHDGNERLIVDQVFFESQECKWLDHEQVTKIVKDTVKLKSPKNYRF